MAFSNNENKTKTTTFPDDSSGSGTGTGSGNIAVYDEGTLVNATVTKLNFIGTEVVAKQDGADIAQVDIYIPPPDYVSHYNTTDGSNNGMVNSIATANRHVSNPGTFDIGPWTAGSVHPTTRSGTLHYNSASEVLFETLTTTILAEVIGADGTTTIASCQIDNPSGNTSNTNQNITIQVSNFDTNGDKWKGRINTTINISSIIPSSGKFSVRITHQQPSGNYVKTQSNLFYDSEPNTAVLTGVSITESAGRITKFLSGVQYYDLNSPFTVDIADIDYLNGDSYPTTQVEVRGPEYGLPALNLAGTDLTDWTNDWDDIDDTYHSDDWEITAVNYRFIGDNANILGRTVDWTTGSDVLSPDSSILIDTWVSQSDELSEYFTDEDYRLMSDYTTPWDSTQSLDAYDDNNGLQIMSGVAKVPSSLSASNNNNADFSSYNPLPNPDYSSFSGNTYYREFTDVTNSVRTSARLAIQGFTLQNLIDEDVLLFIDIPGKFTSECYAHSPNEFDFGSMDGDNDPIRVDDSTTNDIHISFGTYGLDSTHNVFRIRLVIQDATIEPSSIVVSW